MIWDLVFDYRISGSHRCTHRLTVPFEKLEGLFVELCRVLENRRVRTVFEGYQLRIANIASQTIGKTERSQLITAAKRDLRGRRYTAEFRLDVVSDYGIRLLDKRVN